MTTKSTVTALTLGVLAFTLSTLPAAPAQAQCVDACACLTPYVDERAHATGAGQCEGKGGIMRLCCKPTPLNKTAPINACEAEGTSDEHKRKFCGASTPCPPGHVRDSQGGCAIAGGKKIGKRTTCPPGHVRDSQGACAIAGGKKIGKRTTCPPGYVRDSQGACAIAGGKKIGKRTEEQSSSEQSSDDDYGDRKKKKKKQKGKKKRHDGEQGQSDSSDGSYEDQPRRKSRRHHQEDY